VQQIEREGMRVLKKLGPERAGAIKLARRYGDALVCVRYRRNANGSHRYTTVELIVDCVAVVAKNGKAAERIVGVRVGFNEAQLRQQVRDSGAKWDAPARLWRMPLRAARQLGLLDRVVEN
jgi:hypothetical protein